MRQPKSHDPKLALALLAAAVKLIDRAAWARRREPQDLQRLVELCDAVRDAAAAERLAVAPGDAIPSDDPLCILGSRGADWLIRQLVEGRPIPQTPAIAGQGVSGSRRKGKR